MSTPEDDSGAEIIDIASARSPEPERPPPAEPAFAPADPPGFRFTRHALGGTMTFHRSALEGHPLYIRETGLNRPGYRRLVHGWLGGQVGFAALCACVLIAASLYGAREELLLRLAGTLTILTSVLGDVRLHRRWEKLVHDGEIAGLWSSGQGPIDTLAAWLHVRHGFPAWLSYTPVLVGLTLVWPGTMAVAVPVVAVLAGAISFALQTDTSVAIDVRRAGIFLKRGTFTVHSPGDLCDQLARPEFVAVSTMLFFMTPGSTITMVLFGTCVGCAVGQSLGLLPRGEGPEYPDQLVEEMRRRVFGDGAGA